jgi:membrane-associated phospholipid phosphatase
VTSDRTGEPADDPAGDGAGIVEARWRARRRWVYAAFALGLAIFVVWFGIPTDRLGLAALATGFLSIGLLGKGWAAWRRMMLDWAPFTLVLLAYDYSRGFASPYTDEQMDAHDYPTRDVHNDLGLPLQVDAPIDFDQQLAGLFGVATTPTQWLQAELHPGPVDGTAIPWFALAVSLVYCSHYLVMPVTAVVTWLRDRSEFRYWMSMVVTLAVAGLATYVLLPTAPPWLASHEGDLPGPYVLRLTSEGFDQVGLGMVGSALSLGQHLVNPVAAMPSLHVAFATLAAGFWWSRVRRSWRWLLPLYPLAMCFSLTYAGEHYVLDELAGVAYALVILVVAGSLRRRRQTHWLDRNGKPSTPSAPVFTAST